MEQFVGTESSLCSQAEGYFFKPVFLPRYNSSTLSSLNIGFFFFLETVDLTLCMYKSYSHLSCIHNTSRSASDHTIRALADLFGCLTAFPLVFPQWTKYLRHLSVESIQYINTKRQFECLHSVSTRFTENATFRITSLYIFSKLCQQCAKIPHYVIYCSYYIW